MVLFHTCDAETYRDTVELFINEVPIERWNSLPAFHLSTPYDEAIMPHNDRILGFEHSVRRLSNLGLIGTRVFLHAENVLLAEHLANYLGVEVSPLPIPPFKPIHSKSARESMDVMNVMYLGAARTEKGFVVLPDVVSQCLKKGLKVRFTIQVTPQILGYTPDIERAVEQLKEIDDPRVKLLEEPLSQPDYKRTLSHADIVLLCYQPDRYAVRSSGIAVEAVLSEATIIATQNTFPAFLSGDAGIQISDASEIVDAITRVARNRKGYQIAARARRQWYLNQYGSEAFVNALVRHKCQDINTTHAFATHKFEDSTRWRRLI